MRNLGQTKCQRCQRWHLGCLQEKCIADYQWQELVDYAKANGRSWKAKLREEWFQGKETLRWARNLIGPRDLDKVKLDAQKYERRIRGRILKVSA